MPNVRGKSILSAITTLQRAGFKVSVPEGFRFGSLTPTPTVGREAPLGGTRMQVGATVTLTDSRYGCCIGSPLGGAPRVPDLVGSTAQEAIRELRRMHLPWEIRVRPFVKEQRTLLTTVRVVSQSPAPGLLVVHGGLHVPTMTAAYPASRPASAATVTGRVVIEGGSPTLPGQSDVHPVGFARIVASGTTTSGLQVSRHLRADTHGVFQLALPPGVYTLTAVIFGPASRALAKQPHVKVTVKDERSLHVQIKGHVN